MLRKLKTNHDCQLASGFFHLQSPTPLFTRLIALGGSPLIQPLPPPVAETAFSIATSALGLAALPPSEQVHSLLALPPAEIVTKLAGTPLPLAAIADGDLVQTVPTYAGLADAASLETALFPGAKWCKTILVGDAEWDGMIIPLAGRAGASLKTCLETVFADAPAVAAAVVEGYGLEAGSESTLPVVKYINDVAFALGAKATATAWAAAGGGRLGTKAYLAHFNLPNPWEGPWKGYATHAFDCAIALGNYNEFLGEGQKVTAEAFAGDIISFVDGKEPFPAFSSKADGKAKVYYAGVDSTKDESAVVSESDESATKRRGILEKAVGGDPAVADKLLGVFRMLLQGPPQ